MHLLNDLNPEQRDAALHFQGPLLILAGAGSGKTKTITYRIAHLIQHHGVASTDICGVTFTNKAAKEMQQRIKKLLPKNIKPPLLCTFHALCIRILREHIHHLGFDKNFTIYDSSDQMSVIRQCLSNIKHSKNFDRKLVQSIISKLKNNRISARKFSDSKYFDPSNEYHHVVADVFPEYQRKLKLLNALDFDDLLFYTVDLLNSFPTALESVARKFQYLLVDEYQDTNPMQFELIQLLTSKHQNICVVGDDDQSIYAFRGADVGIILNFSKYFKNAKTISLEQNYRSTKNILDLANVMIAQNKYRHPKKLWSTIESSELPLLWSCQDDEHEALVISDDVLNLRKQGQAWSQIAVLCRSNNQFLKIEDAFKENQIPYEVFGGQKFYEKKEIKDLLSYLAYLSNPKDDIALRRIINVPSRGIGDQTLETLNTLSLEKDLGITQIINQELKIFRPSTQQALLEFLALINDLRSQLLELPLATVVQSLIEKINYISYIKMTYSSQPSIAELKKNDVTHLVDSIERFEKRHSYKNARECLYEFLQFSMLQNSPSGDDESEVNQDVVSMMTMHASKGLEFDYVYLPGVEEEILPHKKTIELNEDISEERRLFYVAITRARKKLVMSYAKEKKIYNAQRERLCSRFLQNLDAYFTYQDRTTLGHLTEEEAQAYKKNFFNDLSKLLD
jgi:DNA helicase-2/ATP-dependent DNA helicase PcrA